MRWLYNLTLEPISNNKHYFPPEGTRDLIDSTKPSLEYQVKYLPSGKNGDKQNSSVSRAKEKCKNSINTSLCQRFLIGSILTLLDIDGAFFHSYQLGKGCINKTGHTAASQLEGRGLCMW